MRHGIDDIIERFFRYFTVCLARNEEDRKAVFSIRYRVYGEEFGYEDITAFPDRMERDEYDDHALHCLIRHAGSGVPAACVRLVPARAPLERFPLPFEKYCYESVDRAILSQLDLKRDKMCEISRLAVDRIFRRRAGEAVSRFGKTENLDFDAQEERTFPLLAVACFFGAGALTVLSGRPQVFAMMEPFLPRLLKRSGFLFQRVGRDIEYHGTRALYFIRTESAQENMKEELRPLYNGIYQQLDHSIQQGALDE